MSLTDEKCKGPHERPCIDWRPIKTAPTDGTPVRLYAQDLVHEDFNPGGSVEGYWQDDEGWIGAVWCDYHDRWEAKAIQPTHWMPLPPPPSADTQQQCCCDIHVPNGRCLQCPIHGLPAPTPPTVGPRTTFTADPR